MELHPAFPRSAATACFLVTVLMCLLSTHAVVVVLQNFPSLISRRCIYLPGITIVRQNSERRKAIATVAICGCDQCGSPRCSLYFSQPSPGPQEDDGERFDVEQTMLCIMRTWCS